LASVIQTPLHKDPPLSGSESIVRKWKLPVQAKEAGRHGLDTHRTRVALAWLNQRLYPLVKAMGLRGIIALSSCKYAKSVVLFMLIGVWGAAGLIATVVKSKDEQLGMVIS